MSISAIEQEKNLTGNDRLEIGQVWKDYAASRDQGMRNEIVLHYSDLVKFTAIRMRGLYKNYAQLDDIVNHGMIALIDAVEKFDITRDIKFETFASIKVRGSVIDYIRSQDWVPRRLRKQAGDLEQVNSRLHAELGRQPTNKEIAAEMDISVEQLDKVMEQSYNFNLLSYEDVIWQQASSMGEEPATNGLDDLPEGRLMEQELRQQLAVSLDKLNERERTVVSLYYYEELKLREIAEVLGVSESRVCQIHSAAIVKMQKTMKEYITE